MSDLPAEWLPSVRKVSRRGKLLRRAQESKPSRASTFVSDTPLDDWIPSWLGATRTPSVKASLANAWKKALQDSQESSSFLSSSMSLWLTHAVLNIVTFKDVFLHLLMLLRMISERTSFTPSSMNVISKCAFRTTSVLQAPRQLHLS